LSFKGLFIGIDRYASPGVNWLSFARRDAAALHGPFTDLMGGETVLSGRAGPRSEEFRRLEGAPPRHIVVVAFSGHGSETHELVAYDTDPYDIPGPYRSRSQPLANGAHASHAAGC
jgi:hypothetical protein